VSVEVSDDANSFSATNVTFLFRRTTTLLGHASCGTNPRKYSGYCRWGTPLSRQHMQRRWHGCI
jgi:hypothetical protein